MAAAPLALRGRTAPLAGVAAAAAAAAPALALVAITALAAVLRFEGLGGMQLNPYYDAAVRSMGSSWHAFFVGAFNPNASVAIDKPPVDLWLQVATTKLFGFTHVGLLLPEALASTLAVVLMYDLVRRGFGRTAGLAAAAALAVLPVEVVTARSDTMDSVMMALLVLAAWLVVRAVERDRGRELYLAGAVVGLAFETKLFEALLPLPALALMFVVGSRLPWRRRVSQLAVAGAVMACVALAWPAAFALTPAHDRPYPMGSKNGSIWDTVFVYNGLGRLSSTSTRQRVDHLNPPGVARLFSHGFFHLDALIGTALFAAIAFGVVALAVALWRRRPLGKVPLAVAAGMGTWLVLAAVLLSLMRHVPVRYLEPLTPAVAAVLGIGVGVVARAGAGGALAMLAATAASLVYASSTRGLSAAAIAAAIGAASIVLLVYVRGRGRLAAGALAGSLSALAAALAVVAVLAVPTAESAALVRAHTGDGGELGAMPARATRALSAYLTRHRDGRRYEFASLNAALAGPLIVADGQPVLVLAGWPPHPLVSVRGLRDAVRAGHVRYVLLSAHGRRHPVRTFPRRATRPRDRIIGWVRSHGVDVSHRAGLHRYGILYRVAAR